MNIRVLSCIILFILHVHTVYSDDSQQGIVIVPVLDLVDKPFEKDQLTSYPLPLSTVTTCSWCRRGHQLLFNERVTILETRGNEIKVRLPHVFYQQSPHSARGTDYWTLKHGIIPLQELALLHQGIVSQFPESIDFTQKKIPHHNTATLFFPYYDPVTQQTYSAGTRFARAPSNTKKNTVAVYAFCPRTKKMVTIALPKQKCITTLPTTAQQKVVFFIWLLEQWAHPPHGFIPYVLGGCSFTATCLTPEFIEHKKEYTRPNYHITPATGFDCTGMIARAAQIAGIPYFFKNTTTLALYLKPLKKADTIENGDIIWFKGHALVITNKDKHICIEARSYDHGFGKVHELPIAKLFANNTTVDDIQQAIATHKPLYRLNNKEQVVQTVPEATIFRFCDL